MKSARKVIKAAPALKHMGGCQNNGPFLGTLSIRCCIIIGTQKGTIILTTTHILECIVTIWGVYRGHARIANMEPHHGTLKRGIGVIEV